MNYNIHYKLYDHIINFNELKVVYDEHSIPYFPYRYYSYEIPEFKYMKRKYITLHVHSLSDKLLIECKNWLENVSSYVEKRQPFKINLKLKQCQLFGCFITEIDFEGRNCIINVDDVK